MKRISFLNPTGITTLSQLFFINFKLYTCTIGFYYFFDMSTNAYRHAYIDITRIMHFDDIITKIVEYHKTKGIFLC